MPQAVPKEFADKLFAFHGSPFVWFTGQFFSYMMRPNEQLKQYMAEKKKTSNIQKPYARYVLNGILNLYVYNMYFILPCDGSSHA